VFVSVVSKRIRNTETNRNKPKKIVISFAKQTENQPKQIEFRFVSVRTEKKIVCFEDTLVATLPEHFEFSFNIEFFDFRVSAYQKGRSLDHREVVFRQP
jgi:hypothetical protein